MKAIKTIFSIAILAIFVASMAKAQSKPWDIPANYKDMKSSVKTSPASIQAGEAIYKKTCAACHGKTGVGNGPKAKSLDTTPTDFTKAAFQNETDGAIFYQTKVGREDMPKYDKKIEDSDIWNIVNYLRTLKK
jgi:mono/diheme cytochrome c family protein